MVSNKETTFDKEISTLAEGLIEHLEWARRNHVKTLPPIKAPEVLPVMEMSEEIMPSQKNDDPSHAIQLLLSQKENPTELLKRLQNDIIGDCKRCKLCENRNKVVFGTGDSLSKLVFVGEAPGAEEDRLGEPFVGRAGQLLTKMIEAMGLSRDRIYICNVVKCRPPNNRDPEQEEVSSCEPFLKAQLAIIKPEVIVTLGRYACQTLLKTTTPMSQIRGNWAQYEGIAVMPTFHPAFLLRNPPKKKEVWEDLQQVMQRLGLSQGEVKNNTP